MTRAKKTANQIRAAILIAGILYLVAAVAWVFFPLTPYFDQCKPDKQFCPTGLLFTPLAPAKETVTAYTLGVVVLLGLLFLAQWGFLRPRRAWTANLAAEGKPLKSAIIVAAAMAMLLTLGAGALSFELFDSWADWMDKEFSSAAPWIYGAMLAAWVMWALIFAAYWRQGDRYTQLGRMIRALVAGSFLEAFVAVPVHVAVTRQRECYCSRGTYTTLVCAGTVLFWAFGPGIVLLYAREKYRQAKLFSPRCANCDYDLRGNLSGVCPECGRTINPPAAPC